MKTNPILILATAIFALGSAMAVQNLIPTTTWISGQTTATGNPTTCSTVGEICASSATSIVCRVLVTLETQDTKDTRGFTSNACVQPHYATHPTPIAKPNLVNVIAY